MNILALLVLVFLAILGLLCNNDLKEPHYKSKSKSLRRYKDREIKESLPEVIDNIYLRLEKLERKAK